uniref:Uncharacterized protein n=1 Tax=Peromyscus maniculatus bairdii TaxID=230844 RepID=A0A8C8UG61_PERMB
MVLEKELRVLHLHSPAAGTYGGQLNSNYHMGFIHLTVSEWLRLLLSLGVLTHLGYHLATCLLSLTMKQQKDSLIKIKIQKGNPKVVKEINIEDLCLTRGACSSC